jgi:NAD(P)-dependent dehydrogenase (short-subunit alcohol dehydrogenase family)
MANEVVVVTGASAGIGRAVARRFGADGAKVALLGRNRAGLEAAAREIEQAGGQALILPTDVADHDAVEAAAAAAEQQLGPIDIWVNVAMATVFAWFQDIEPEEFERSTDVTYHGYVWGTRAALKRMVPRDRGTIVQVGSAMAYQGIPLQSPYCGAKAAIRGFQQSLRTELRNRGSKVHTTMVHLPGVNTPQFVHARAKMPKVPQPVPPVYQPEVAADAIHWAAHHRRRELWVGLPTVYTILGSRVAEWVAQRYLARTAVKSQQSGEPLGTDVREGNLFTAPGHDEGAHGPYDGRAHARSAQLAMAKHRRAIGAAAAAASAAAGAAVLANRD